MCDEPKFVSWEQSPFARTGSFCNSMKLQPINSPYGFRQYRLLTLHFTRNYDERSLMRSLRQLPTAVSRMNTL